MRKSLYLVRHAEAVNAGPGVKDFERELTPSGYSEAPRMGRKLFEKDIKIDRIYSSNAPRALTTAELIAEQIRFEVNNVISDQEFYESSVRSLLSFVNQLDDNLNHVMIVGHNPVISYFAEYLCGEDLGTMPCCGIAKINFEDMGWSSASQRNGKLEFFMAPGN